MGLSLSCSISILSDLDQSVVSVLEKSTNFRDDERKTPVDCRCKEVACLPSRSDRENEVVPSLPGDNAINIWGLHDWTLMQPTGVDQSYPEHKAAIKLQKVYKSFRTRRKLADCAVLIEQNWWKLLDFVELKHSSISLFDIENHETAISRWSRARTRAAKVGKGLSKNGKAQKLALQHWLKAIDPRHRYGHNLHFYYSKWLHSQSKEPFFYWLDIGEGRDISLVDKCPRSKLQQQCIKYLDPMERKAYEVAAKDGKFFYTKSGEFVDTTGGPKGSKWIFVLSTTKELYVGKKKKGAFQHSSFLAGGATLAAGRIVFEKGNLKAVWPHSGHYRPTPENFQDLISFLRENNVDLTDVNLDAIYDDEEEESISEKDDAYLRSNSENDSTEKDCQVNEISSTEKVRPASLEISRSKSLRIFRKGLSDLEIASKVNFVERLRSEIYGDGHDSNIILDESLSDGDETEEESFVIDEHNNFDQDELQETKEEIISGECVLQRINSHEEMQSFQLGRQLSFKWSTGAGPRIGCVRDYPTGLQSHALEQVNLSPRSIHRLILDLPSPPATPSSVHFERQVPLAPSPGKLSCRAQPPLCQGILTSLDPLYRLVFQLVTTPLTTFHMCTFKKIKIVF